MGRDIEIMGRSTLEKPRAVNIRVRYTIDKNNNSVKCIALTPLFSYLQTPWKLPWLTR